MPLSVGEWARMLWLREELEYTLPDEEDVYQANAVNRFRQS